MTGLQAAVLVFGSLATVLASVLASRFTGRSSVKVAEIGADQEAYMRAEKIYQSAITRLEKENGDLRAEILELKARVSELENTSHRKAPE